MAEPTKFCPSCTATLALSLFGKNLQSPDAHHYYCLECAAEKQRLRYFENPEAIKAAKKKYRDRVIALNRQALA